MATEANDERLDEIQEEVDEIRRRIPQNPGFDVPDPDIQPVIPDTDDDEEAPPAGTV